MREYREWGSEMRIAIWTGTYQYWGDVHPRNLWEEGAPQMGGSEITALSIAWELAKAGCEVLLGCQVGYSEGYMYDALRVCPLDEFLPTVRNSRFDAMVSWDEPYIYRYNLEHVPVKIMAYELNHTTGGLLEYPVDKHFHPSNWHASRYRELYGIPEEKQVVGLTNGAEPRMFTAAEQRSKTVLWASSPDRGLHHLLRLWPRVIEEIPDAQLHIYYNMEKWLGFIMAAAQAGQIFNTTERAMEVKSLLSQLQGAQANVSYFGGVSHAKCIRAMLEASVLAYTCDPVAPTECFSMVMLEAISAGLHVISTDADAFPELWGPVEGVTLFPLPVDADTWVRAIVRALNNPPATEPRGVPSRYRFKTLAEGWVRTIEECLEQKDLPETC